MDRQSVSITESTLYLACRRKYDFRFRRMLVPTEESGPLTLGKAIHVGLEHWYRTADRVRTLEAAREFLEASAHREELFPLAVGMLEGYLDRYQDAEGFEVVQVEMPFRVPLATPSGRASRIFDLVGRVDLVVRKPDRSLWLVEHKTVGRKDPRYFDKLDTDFQVRAYAWAVGRFLGEPVRGVIYNVLRSKLPAEPEILKSGKVSARATIDTTPEVFEAALVRTGSDPAQYAEILDRLRREENTFYQRREREFAPDELRDFALELYAVTRDMRGAGTALSLYRNPNACALYGGCRYRDLCVGALPEDEVPSRYRTLSVRHPELADVDLSTLTPAMAGQLALPGRVADEFLASLLDGEID